MGVQCVVTNGSFERTLELPDGINADAIKANIAKGVLKVTVPKPAPAQIKKIEVRPLPSCHNMTWIKAN